ncbi:MAG: glycosyltransferase family 39 protein [Verrucomicrobiota bacterium]
MNQENGQLNTGKPDGPARDFLLLTLLWLVSIVIVNPIGDFPLNDDWSFGLAVGYFLQTGSFHPTGWTAMPLITNVLWGSLFCLPAGFSFTALRFSTLVAAWLGMGGVYWLMREIRQPRLLAFLAAFSVAFNPIYFQLSNSFMTDVLSLTLMIFSAIFFLKNLKDNSPASLGIATVISLAAILSRQVGLAVPLAFAIAAVCQRGLKPRAVLTAVSPLILGAFTLAAFQHWLKAAGRWPADYSSGSTFMLSGLNSPARSAFHLVHNSYKCVMYLGFFLAPVLVFLGPGFGDLRGKKWLPLAFIWLSLAGLVIVGGCYGHGFTMPLGGDTMNVWGMGPLTLHDVVYEDVPRIPMLGLGFWLPVTLISWVAAGLILYRLGTIAWKLSPGMLTPGAEPGAFAGLFLLLISLIYAAPFLLSGFYDRYLIAIIPFLIGGLAFYRPQNPFASPIVCRVTITFLAIGFLVYSVGGAKDYLAWNRARWTALDDLMANEKIKPANIDGGLEFNGYYLYRSAYKVVPGKSFWWVDDDSYMVTFNPIPGYRALHSYHYPHWLPPFTGDIFMLKKDPANLSATRVPSAPSAAH